MESKILSINKTGVNVLCVVSSDTAKKRMKEDSKIKEVTRDFETYEELINGIPFGCVDYLFSSELSEIPAIKKLFGNVPIPVGKIYEDEDFYGRKELCQYFTDCSYRKVGA